MALYGGTQLILLLRFFNRSVLEGGMTVDDIIINYSSPVYSAADGSSIDCQITLASGGAMPFTASANDCEQYGRDLHRIIAVNADKVPILPYVPPAAPSSDALPTKLA